MRIAYGSTPAFRAASAPHPIPGRPGRYASHALWHVGADHEPWGSDRDSGMGEVREPGESGMNSGLNRAGRGWRAAGRGKGRPGGPTNGTWVDGKRRGAWAGCQEAEAGGSAVGRRLRSWLWDLGGRAVGACQRRAAVVGDLSNAKNGLPSDRDESGIAAAGSGPYLLSLSRDSDSRAGGRRLSGSTRTASAGKQGRRAAGRRPSSTDRFEPPDCRSFRWLWTARSPRWRSGPGRAASDGPRPESSRGSA
jgi:hypothetical protein